MAHCPRRQHLEDMPSQRSRSVTMLRVAERVSHSTGRLRSCLSRQ